MCEPHEAYGMVGKVIVEAAEIIEPEEVVEEVEEMPFISASSILMVLAFVALSRKSAD
ncbi:MAG: Uncharacterised protein [Methanobacteriota archaeon]|nr:MAG: Uncharacterised protein [Euryarchaeota archaeon]